MKHKYAQRQKLSQKMALTPQMRQSIKMLGMSTRDLNELIDSAVEENPFLEKEIIQREDRIYEKRLSRATSSAIDAYDSMANMRHEESPRLGLISQIKMLGIKGKAFEIAEYLIYELDDNGYLKADLDDAAEALSASLDEVEAALKLIQALEPAGIGARDIRECLRLQLGRVGKSKSLEYAIISDFSNELARNDISRIAKALGSGAEAVKKAVSNIKKLNPRPGSTLLSEKTKNVIPDLIAEINDKDCALRLNREWLPILHIRNPYDDKPDISNDKESEKFIKESMASAKGLMDNLKRREETIYRITEYILKFQFKSFTKQEEDFKTLTLDDVAKALSLHKSTISRVVTNKYIQINYKVYSIKKLLSRGIINSSGEITSKTAIKKKIEKIIKDEDKKHPLSDDAIRSRLEESESITLQRRLIAKYRNSLKLLPAHLRRRSM